MSARIDKLDLKMLRVLAVVARTRNTYRAAEELYLSQSAVSRALSRLRDALDDPVFVRTPDGLEATALTERIVSRLPELFELLEGVVEEEGQFDPASWTGSASIAMGSPATRCWGSALYEALSQQAPNVTWNFETWRNTTVSDILEGKVSLGIHFVNDRWPQALYQQRVGKDDYVLMARKGHPALRGKQTMKLFEQHSLVSLLLPDWNDYDNLLESALRGQGVEPKVSLRTDNLGLALESVRDGNSLMAGTRALARQFDNLKTLDYPSQIPLPESTVVMCFPRRLRNSARYLWLADEVKAVIKAST